MYLKKLELNGFKSFAQPSILEFSSGITAIVGPNGSGKSNIADAVRWILGEQSMKNIRSHSNRDLIFSGSKSRSRLGKANVSLYFDNQSGCIPLDYSEVVISRNIFRDGTSEYFINENLTKLMNVVETLAKANVGHRGFSVINQGMESEILRYNSSELYELLEEASGVRYLQLRKRRSGRQLKSTQTNLEKISGILIELIPHLRYLKREATKAERREKLEKKLEKIQKQFFFLRLIDLENQEKKLIKEKESLDLKIFQLKKEVSCLEEELKEEEVAIKQGSEKFINAQKELEKILDERVKLGEQLANLKAQIQLEKGKQPVEENREISIGYIYSALKNLLKFENLNEIKNKISLILERIEKNIENPKLSEKNKQINAGQLDKLLGEQKDLEEVLTEINQKYEAQKTILRSGQKELGQENFFNVERTLRRKRDALNDLKNRFKELNWLLEQTEENFKELKQDITKAGIDYKSINSKKNKNSINGSVEQLEEEINRLKYKAEEIGGVDEITLQEYKETKERYEKLTKKIKDLEKAKQNLENLIMRLTKEIGGQFDKKFQAINNNFNKYFRLLFNGGRAYLRQITKTQEARKELEENDESESEEIGAEGEVIDKGIEIKAVLPGKKVRDLRMFSGGEKALTSIALLFAIVSSNPPPFLVLDEADATLDESNSRRFAKLISEFSKDTQFIIITHNRETMSQADVLYGVTMGEDGVSSLLSLKLEE